MTLNVEQVLTQAQALSPEEKKQLLEALNNSAGFPSAYEERLAKIRAFRGKYKHLFSSAEEFMARKREESDHHEMDDLAKAGVCSISFFR